MFSPNLKLHAVVFEETESFREWWVLICLSQQKFCSLICQFYWLPSSPNCTCSVRTDSLLVWSGNCCRDTSQGCADLGRKNLMKTSPPLRLIEITNFESFEAKLLHYDISCQFILNTELALLQFSSQYDLHCFFTLSLMSLMICRNGRNERKKERGRKFGI